MRSAKLPLFGGIILPLVNGDDLATALTVLGGPVDKNLPKGEQAIYEIHLWLIPAIPAIAASTGWVLSAIYDGDLPSFRVIAAGDIPSAGGDYTYPVKILDGYPMRGNATLSIGIVLTGEAANQYPVGAQVFGYAYRVGQGDVFEPERRFIGEPSPDGITVGTPLALPATTKKVLHRFESGHIDELSLHFQPYPAEAQVDLYFEDVNDQPVIPGHKVSFLVPVGTEPNNKRDPQSIYTIFKAVFGNTIFPNLDHISIEASAIAFADGYFTRW